MLLLNRVVFCLGVLIPLLKHLCGDSVVEVKVNKNWKSQGCDELDLISVYGAIRVALKTEQRDVYLSLDSSWMDRFSYDGANVLVTCLPLSKLEAGGDGTGPEKFVMKTPDKPHKIDEEVLQVLFVQIPSGSYKVTPYTSGPIDGFLTSNPCWVILHEPPYTEADSVPISTIHHNSKNPGATESLYHINTYSTLTSTFYDQSAIFVRLPTFGYELTCKFFTHIVSRQFPESCPHHRDLYIHHMQSYGFGGETNKVVKSFGHNYFSSDSKIYAQPRHEMKNWIWANDTICPKATFEFNPWACTFIPISKCPAPDDVESTKEWGNYDFRQSGSNHATLKKLSIDGNQFKQFDDGAGLHNLESAWATLRLYAFLHRPNARTRHLIRQATKRIRLIGPQHLHNHGGGHIHSDAHRLGNLHVGERVTCVGMHVRNQDVMTDFRRERPVDRSLNAHVYAAMNMTRELGTIGIYLATDNNTLYRIAPLEYPSFKWYAQHRPIRHHYDQHRDHLNEKDPQRELANLLTDALGISKCNGLVGQGDGSITLFYHIYNCNHARNSVCPPFFDLQRLMYKGKMPYIGKHHDSTTYSDYEFPFPNHQFTYTGPVPPLEG